ncbi:Peptidase family M48 [Desulfocicer vacuolatum DSM 3385]|uniref:Peptidase family M48 n=1 Tax=Desulfocicer vacuolatum DSM 3385 TaxID=1121400 RepID=A0A1W2C063_9BACT|nr:M48 family metallopeptidase [Desulfocicer vacuolatum]SMC78302.1 Peptidase family M48 [Desulfocicer vacuolatum DSM 3385]
MGFAILAMIGDIVGSSEFFLGLPVFLTQMAYSRGFEREADDYALQRLRQKSIPTEHFVRLMERIDQKMAKIANTSNKKWLNYLSSHPDTKRRLEAFRNETR